ncbi:MAG: crossover junction endodeoxyribonuclease RuvC [Sedimenticola sp.]|nr:crossover junction endodeoxyribonuclease RuvC [Sedimenticola sp.]
MRLILGIDPGSRITGYGIIESNGIRSRHVASGCIRIAQEAFPERLGEIFRQLSGLVADYRPAEMAIEQVFMAKNAASALKLGQARGAAICACVVAGLPVYEYSPRAIKQAVVGSGGADKEQVQHMIRHILQLEEKLSPDQSDALAVAISHAHTSTTAQLIRGAGRRWR